MFLHALPTDLLLVITTSLHYLDVANLWFTGSKALHFKLAAGAVSHLDVQISADFRPFVWPSLFSQLTHLTRLSITGYHAHPKDILTSDILQMLPSKVKEMHLHATGAFTAMQQLLLRQMDALPMLETLNITINVSMFETTPQVVHWPQSLVSLTLHRDSPLALPLNPSTLPTHLTHLDGSYISIETSSSSEVSKLPDSLTCLVLRFQNAIAEHEILDLLPIGIKSLGLGVHGATGEGREIWREKSISRLPRGLTALTSWPVELTRECLQNLPPALTLLDCSYSLFDLDILPESIVTSTVPSGVTFENHLVQRSMLANLPRGLTKLKLEVLALPFLPTTGVNVEVQVVGNDQEGLIKVLKEAHLEMLPLRLTRMTLFERREEEINFPWQILPPTFTSLTLYLRHQTFKASQVASFPRWLRELEVNHGCGFKNEKAFSALPSGLTSLKLSFSPTLGPESSKWLPRGLTFLSIGQANKIEVSWFEGLPASLNALHAPILLDSLPQHPLSSNDKAGEVWRLPLPPSLIQLTLRLQLRRGSVSNPVNLRHLFASFPRNLKDVFIDADRLPGKGHFDLFQFSASDLSLLPRRLESLYMPTNESIDFDEAVKCLPKTLLKSPSFYATPRRRHIEFNSL